MKRKITFAIIAISSAMMSMAHANDGFGKLVFKSASGESYYVETQGLEIYFKDGNVTFNNNELSIPTSQLVSMEFSNNTDSGTGVEEILSNTTESVTVYYIDGVKVGEYSSLAEACQSLKTGVYVVRYSNGQTVKIKLEK